MSFFGAPFNFVPPPQSASLASPLSWPYLLPDALFPPKAQVAKSRSNLFYFTLGAKCNYQDICFLTGSC